jgi:ribosomal protein S27AE
MAFGAYPDASLAQARDAMSDARKQLAGGADPMAQRKANKLARQLSADNSFATLSRLWWKQWKSARSESHTEYVIRRLEGWRQRVPILATGCTNGGKRYWFGCPRCGKRAAILYLHSHRFACRNCQRLAYASQSEDEVGRMWRKQSKVEERLGGSWNRPKGMHRYTHERLLQVVLDCEEKRDTVRLGWPG